MEDNETSTGVSPYLAAVRGRCPRCGVGKLYAGVLKLAPRCSHCDLEIEKYDSDDGPAAFATFVVGPLAIGPVVWLEFSVGPPIWVHVLIWPIYLTLLCLGALRVIKSLMVAAQFKHKAEQGRLDED